MFTSGVCGTFRVRRGLITQKIYCQLKSWLEQHMRQDFAVTGFDRAFTRDWIFCVSMLHDFAEHGSQISQEIDIMRLTPLFLRKKCTK